MQRESLTQVNAGKNYVAKLQRTMSVQFFSYFHGPVRQLEGKTRHHKLFTEGTRFRFWGSPAPSFRKKRSAYKVTMRWLTHSFVLQPFYWIHTSILTRCNYWKHVCVTTRINRDSNRVAVDDPALVDRTTDPNQCYPFQDQYEQSLQGVEL